MPRLSRVSTLAAPRHPLAAALETPVGLLLALIYVGLAAVFTVQWAGATAAMNDALPALSSDCNP